MLVGPVVIVVVVSVVVVDNYDESDDNGYEMSYGDDSRW